MATETEMWHSHRNRWRWVQLFVDFFAGTLAPDFLASESPIATACFRLVTLLPDPLFNFPCLKAFISRSTLVDAFGPYFLVLDFFPVAVSFVADCLRLLDVLDRLVGIDFSLIQGLEAAGPLRVVGAQTQKDSRSTADIQIKNFMTCGCSTEIFFSGLVSSSSRVFRPISKSKRFSCLHQLHGKYFSIVFYRIGELPHRNFASF